MIRCDIRSIGLICPGLPSWRDAVPVLTGRAAYLPGALEIPDPKLLSPSERRRSTAFTKLAMAAGEAALADAGTDGHSLTSVFASGSGDMDVIDKICTSLMEPDRPISPTHFHNSVHNATAGHWAIAARCREPSISLSAHDSTFAAGLLEAGATVSVDHVSVLLIACDVPPPFPLAEKQPMLAAFAVALLLSPPGTWAGRLARLRIAAEGSAAGEDRLSDPGLEALRTGNPSARSLPLLAAIAGSSAGEVSIGSDPGARLRVAVEP
ncbi:MAG: beta-ketoacyl synthase chain length factor [Rhodospirillales bacterium]|nr:beta-ketoacyl synthase chain length factor [Rhodospirillales bacterium]